MPLNIRIDEDELFATLAGEIDHHHAKDLRETIDNVCAANLPSTLVLDFGGVSFMDSSGIGLIMGRYKLMSDLGGSVRVVNVPEHLKKVMQLAGLQKLKIFDNGGM